MTNPNPVEEYILEKYGELLGIYEDIARSTNNELDYYSIRSFSTGYIIYSKNPKLGDDFDNGVPRGSPFDQGIMYSGDVRTITHIRYLPSYPADELGMGYIIIFEPEKVAIYRITADKDKNGIDKFIVFPRPEGLSDAAIPQIRAFTWSRDDVVFQLD